VTRLLSLIALAACSSHGTVAHPTPGRDAGPPAAEAGPTDAECDGLFDHAIALRTAGDAQITEADRSKIQTDLREHWSERCRAMPRKTYACALAAATLDAFTACDDPGKSPTGDSAQP